MFLNPWYTSPQAGGVVTANQQQPPHPQQQQQPSPQQQPQHHHHQQHPPHLHPHLAPIGRQAVPSLPALHAIRDYVQSRLRAGWTVHYTYDGRFYYCNHATQTSSWLPPLCNWDAGSTALPYGWEAATDKEGKPYFINHLNKTTTYEDPRKDYLEEPPQPRQVQLTRDIDLGFGFVAGSEKPVIVRFVTENGPSVDKLLPGDQILSINGEDVKKAPRDHVIQLVRSCKERVVLTVMQPPLDNSARKSALLSAAKKQRLKANPSRVRFAESVDINGSPSYSPSNFTSTESTTPFMPNVLKVFLENGQTKSFKYDSSTTVGDVLDSLQQKLGIKCPEHLSLVVEHVKSLRRNKLTLLDPKESLARIAARPGAQHLRCLYRVTFVPRDAYDLLRKDSVAFEYLFMQVNGRDFLSTPYPYAELFSPSALNFFERYWNAFLPPPLVSLPPSSSSSLLPENHPVVLQPTLASQVLKKGLWGQVESCSFTTLVPSSFLNSSSDALSRSVSSYAPTAPHWSAALLRHVLSRKDPSLQIANPVLPKPREALSRGFHTTPPVGAFRKPNWRQVSRWLWRNKRLFHLLYQMRFVLFLLKRLKALGKFALKLKAVALVVKHFEFLMKHLRQIGAMVKVLLKVSAVRKTLRVMRKLFRLNLLWNFLKKRLRKK